MERWTFTRRAWASAFFALALTLGAVASGCGREPTMASKSATAYREAVEQGLPVGSGHGGHGGSDSGHHSVTTMPADTAQPAPGPALAANDHSEHGSKPASAASDPMPKGDRSDRAQRSASSGGVDHPRHGAGTATSAASPSHSHPAVGPVDPTTGPDHLRPAGGLAGPEAGMPHGTMVHASPDRAEPLSAPTSSAELARLDPARTLAPDEFDQAATPPADRATANGDQGAGHQHPPAQAAASGVDTVTPETGHEQGPTTAAVFTCSMHPEVASAQPGTCPKCGMTLVKKEKP